uniref:Ig-like domain-containing protein n=1 Tax=Poecilia mexicana TaxID=48701 RepID=A0A3B3YIV7_9TELE
MCLIFIFSVLKEKHFLKFYFTGSSGHPNFPQFEVVAEVDGSLVAYCNRTDFRLTHDWVKKILDDDVELATWFKKECFHSLPNIFQARISELKQRLKQPEGTVSTGFLQYGYNGEDFLALDIERDSWIALKQQAIPTKLAWDTDKARLHHSMTFTSQWCPDWLKRSLHYGRNFLMRPGNMTRSSFKLYHRVICHATGFYPEKARLFWRKDGEEIHQFMNHEEILPNNDGTFQMSADLDVSSVKAERTFENVLLHTCNVGTGLKKLPQSQRLFLICGVINRFEQKRKSSFTS